MCSCGRSRGHFELLVPMVQQAKKGGVIDPDYREASGCYCPVRTRRGMSGIKVFCSGYFMPNKNSRWQLWPEEDRVIKNWDPSAMKVWSPYQASNVGPQKCYSMAGKSRECGGGGKRFSIIALVPVKEVGPGGHVMQTPCIKCFRWISSSHDLEDSVTQ